MAECADAGQMNGADAAGAVAGATALQIDADERLEDEERKKRREQPIVYKDLDVCIYSYTRDCHFVARLEKS